MMTLVLVVIGVLILLGGRVHGIYAGAAGFVAMLGFTTLLAPDQRDATQTLLAFLVGLVCVGLTFATQRRLTALWAMLLMGSALAILVDTTASPLWLHWAILVTGSIFGLLLYLLHAGWTQSAATTFSGGALISTALYPLFPDLTAFFTFLMALMIAILGLLLQFVTTTRPRNNAEASATQ
jgi:hypothetical protein